MVYNGILMETIGIYVMVSIWASIVQNRNRFRKGYNP